jgi:quinoprotein glucose dehydrogenase
MKRTHSIFAAVLLLFLQAKAESIFQSFEGDGFGEWQSTGRAFGLSPVHGSLDGVKIKLNALSDYAFAFSAHEGSDSTGSLLSPEFTISESYIHFRIAGGDMAEKTAVQLLIDGKVVREVLGKRIPVFAAEKFDVTGFQGQKARLRVVDEATGEWGFIALDHVVFSKDSQITFPSSHLADTSEADGLVSSPELAGAVIPKDTKLKIEADFQNQGIKSPTALSFDEQGNLYVAETHRFRYGVEDDRNHLYWYLDDLAAKTTADRRKLHEKFKKKVSIESLTKFSELIRRLSDSNGDGTLDKSTVYSDAYNDVLDGTAAGVYFFEGSLYFACIPKIYKLQDTNNDGVADEKKVVEEGFGVRISLSGHDMNGFTLGPDGRIYGSIGDRGFSFITKEGKEYQYPNEGAAFRFEPDGSSFEIFHTGLRNPKEIAFDEYGNCFTVDNNSDQGDGARIVYLVQGGDSGWQMEHQAMHTFHRSIDLQERPLSRWMNERMWELRNEEQPSYIIPPCDHLSSGPSGLAYHPGVGFLESEKGRFLICDYRGGAANSAIWSFKMEPDGGSMKMSDSRKFSGGVAVTDVDYSYDGKLFITDFVTGWESHDQGRVISLDAGEKMYKANEAKEAAKLFAEGFAQRESAELAKLLTHADSRVRLRAQIALTRKADGIEFFKKATASSNQIERIHGIWGLGIIARRGSVPSPTGEFASIASNQLRSQAANAILALFKDADAEIRTQALRAISESILSGDSLPLDKALSDESPRVRFAAGIAIGKMKAAAHFPAVLDFIRKNQDRDAYLRHAGIYALEQIAKDPKQISALHQDASPALRLAAVVVLRRLKSQEIAVFLNDSDPKIQDETIRAIQDLDMKELRPLIAPKLDNLDSRKWSDFILRRLIHNSYRIGGNENAARILALASNAKWPMEIRKEAIRLIENWEKPFPADQLSGHYRPLAPRAANTLKPALETALPTMLKSDPFVLASALKLVDTYGLNVTALDDATLLAIVNREELLDEARSRALILLINRDGKDLDAILEAAATNSCDKLAITAIESLVARNPQKGLAAIKEAIASQKTIRAQKAWPLLAKVSGKDAKNTIVESLVTLKKNKGISASAIECLKAAKSRKEPAIIAALADFEKSISENPDPLTKHNISLEGGDPINGEALFAAHPAGQCMRCHKASDKPHSAGGAAGPNLAGIGKVHKKEYLLQAVIAPAAIVAPGYGVTSVTLKNGAVLGGTLLAEAPEHLDVATPEKTVRILRSDIETFTAPVSAMPPMADLLKPHEVRDFVAWLSSLKASNPKPAPPAPEKLDPNTLAPVSTTKTEGKAAPALDPKIGAQQYMLCGACHGQQGEGTAAAPPLAGSEWVTGSAENLIKIQLRGLAGPIKVKGQEYNFPAGMMPMAFQTDEQIASVLTHIRSNFGNKAEPVSAAEVAALRSEVGKPKLTAAELIQPSAPEPKSPQASAARSKKYDNMKSSLGAPTWIFVTIFFFALVCVGAAFKKS